MTGEKKQSWFIIAILAISIYGASYQQYKHFKLNDSRGVSDALPYVAMSEGVYDASIYHQYRFVTPMLARCVMPLLPPTMPPNDEGIIDYDARILAFFIVNYTFTLIATIILFFSFKEMGFIASDSLIGCFLFITNRLTIIYAATPMADAAFSLGIVVLLWLTLRKSIVALALSLPIIVILKELMLPMVIFPIFSKHRKSLWLYVSIAASIMMFYIARSTYAKIVHIENRSMYGDFLTHAYEHTRENLRNFLTVRGIYAFFSGFTIFIPMAVYGFFLNQKYRQFEIPNFLLLFVLIGLFFTIIGGNSVRMFYVAFPAIYAYSLVVISTILGSNRLRLMQSRTVPESPAT